MGSVVDCFLIVATRRAMTSLRRYNSDGNSCPDRYGYHNASVDIGEVDYPMPDDEEAPDPIITSRETQHEDPRWPKKCPCGYEFLEGDTWQYNAERLYVRAVDYSDAVTLRDAKPGSMYYADWYKGAGWIGPDGRTLVVILPDGDPWIVDGPAKGGGRPWQRTGEPPLVTVTPSIQTPRYHGHLRNGQLVEC